MIDEEVIRYKNDMLNYFRARKVDTDSDEHSSSSYTNHQLYTTSLARTTYELEGYTSNESDFTQKVSTGVDDNEDNRSTTSERSGSDVRTRLRSTSYDQDQPQIQTFLTEDPRSTDKVPFYKSFQIPSNLAHSIMFK
jgi:hypothetical protein